MEHWKRELGLGMRRLARSPGFSLTVVFVLGLGLAAATTIFSAVHGVLLADLPYGEPEQLVTLLRSTPRGQFGAFAPAELGDFRQGVGAFREVSGVGQLAVTLTGDGEPARLPAASVSANLFETLGVPPLLGRGFETRAGKVEDLRQVVISFGLWQSRFGGEADILGRTLEVDGEPHRVSAVMPPGFEYPEGARLWLPGERDIPRLPQPFPGDLEQIRNINYYSMIARLKDRDLLEAAAGQLEAVAFELREEFPEEYRETRFQLRPLKEQMVGNAGLQLWILFGAVG
ncbi:MAG: ABC transporter permease, partial [Acidobacteria bacterium]|nr:ABC transporter permease [Acidobacteriota bacterium]